MKKNICLLLAPLVLVGCSSFSELSEQNPTQYAESYKKAESIFKRNRALENFEKDYNAANHKAIAVSKVSTHVGFSNDRMTEKLAIEDALERCNDYLLKKHKEITSTITCEIVNVDNKWITK